MKKKICIEGCELPKNHKGACGSDFCDYCDNKGYTFFSEGDSNKKTKEPCFCTEQE